MQQRTGTQRRVQRAVGDLVLAEMLLVQASIESAAAIGDGVQALGRELGRPRDGTAGPRLGQLLAQTADDAIEPFKVRLNYLRNWLDLDA